MKILKPHCMPLFIFALFLGTASAWAQSEDKLLQPDSVIAPKNNSGYVAKNEGIQSLFNALSSEIKKPFVLSKLAQKKTITGDFDISNPHKFLEKFSTQVGLAWYDDGQTIYVYDNSELKNSVVLMRYASLATLNDFLHRTGLFSKRYPIRGEPKTGTFYVAGPPIYVDLVVNAAAYLDDLYQNVDLNKQKISVIKLHHTFVSDRIYKIRGQEVQIAGIGKVIEAILANEFKELITIKDDPTTKTVLDKDMSQIRSPLQAPQAQSASASEKQVVHENTRIKVIAYPETNSLLVKGSQGQIELIESLIAQLDIPRRHIELSLWVIDITKSALDQLGIDWQGAINVGSRGRVSFNGASSSTLDGNRFLAQITALNQKGIAEVVSRPIILTQDNVPSVFDFNNTFYTKLQAERVVSLEAVTYGTMINVLPRFSTEGDEIEMMLDIEDGRQAAPNNGTLSDVDNLPVITRTTISTVARVPKDKSLLIGGFTVDDYRNTKSKIPFLGDLPLVGGLFRSNLENVQKIVRVYLIQPKLLDLASIWNPEEFTAPHMLAPPDLPLKDTIQRLKDYSGAHDVQY